PAEPPNRALKHAMVSSVYRLAGGEANSRKEEKRTSNTERRAQGYQITSGIGREVLPIFVAMETNAAPNKTTFHRALGVLRHRAYLIFWIGAFISNTGNWTENVAQSWAVANQMVGSPHQGMMVEILQFADFCPVLMLALLAGVISDRVNRKIWVIILQSTACVLGAGLAVAAFFHRATPWV